MNINNTHATVKLYFKNLTLTYNKLTLTMSLEPVFAASIKDVAPLSADFSFTYSDTLILFKLTTRENKSRTAYQKIKIKKITFRLAFRTA